MEDIDKIRKCQVFISSTYQDLLEERQAAVQAILEAEHIPAGMELFAANDQSQWETIKRWIDESNIFMLLLGMRYGSIEPISKKSYIHNEYEYAMVKKKPLFAIVLDEKYIDEKAKRPSTKDPKMFYERDHRDLFDAFKKDLVLSKTTTTAKNIDILQKEIHRSITATIKKHKIEGWVPEHYYTEQAEQIKDMKMKLRIGIDQLHKNESELRKKENELRQKESELKQKEIDFNDNNSNSSMQKHLTDSNEIDLYKSQISELKNQLLTSKDNNNELKNNYSKLEKEKNEIKNKLESYNSISNSHSIYLTENKDIPNSDIVNKVEKAKSKRNIISRSLNFMLIILGIVSIAVVINIFSKNLIDAFNNIIGIQKSEKIPSNPSQKIKPVYKTTAYVGGLFLRDKPTKNSPYKIVIPFESDVQVIDFDGPKEKMFDYYGQWVNILYIKDKIKYKGWVYNRYITNNAEEILEARKDKDAYEKRQSIKKAEVAN